MEDQTLYIFLDESGNLDFSEKGTRFLVFAAVSTLMPLSLSGSLQGLKYSLLKNGSGGGDHEYFHASEDTQDTRDRVYRTIGNHGSYFQVDYIHIDKTTLAKDFKNRDMYSFLGELFSRFLFGKYSKKYKNLEKIIIIFDKALSKKEQDGFLKQVKPRLKTLKIPYAIYFHRTLSDFNAQVADYCAWAKYVSLSRNEKRPLESLSKIESFEIDLCVRDAIND